MRLRSALAPYSLYLAWIVSLAAVFGSLYFSEVRHFVPCKLCWFQRIFMYPQAVLLGIASYRDDRGITRYVVPLCVIGGLISVYHILIEKVPGFELPSPCTEGIPCNYDYINWLGFITIPMLALSAFILILVFLWSGKQRSA